MIAKKYFDMGVTIEKLVVNADLSDCALKQALIQLKFNLNEGRKYVLVIGRYNIEYLLKYNVSFFDISVEIQDDLSYNWYLIDLTTKTVIYSPGA